MDNQQHDISTGGRIFLVLLIGTAPIAFLLLTTGALIVAFRYLVFLGPR